MVFTPKWQLTFTPKTMWQQRTFIDFNCLVPEYRLKIYI